MEPAAISDPFSFPPFTGISSLRRQVQTQKISQVWKSRCPLGFAARRMDPVSCSVSGGSSNPVELDVSFPTDYSQLLEQAKAATELALKDGKQLLEIEFPTAGLESVPGDGEGGIEMTESMQLIREFCDRLIVPEKATRTRVDSFSQRQMKLILQEDQPLKELYLSLII